jgi:hypothetical protein
VRANAQDILIVLSSNKGEAMKIPCLRNTFFVLILTSSAMLNAFSNEEIPLLTSETSSLFNEESDPLFVERLRFRKHRHSHSSDHNVDGIATLATIDQARILIQRYISDLNVSLLASDLDTSQPSAIVNAYNQDIAFATAALQRALAAAGAANQAVGVASAFYELALQAEGVANGTGSIAQLLEAGSDLTDTLTLLSPSIDRTTVTGFVAELITAIRLIILANELKDFSGAVQQVNSAQQTGLDLVNYLFRNIIAS